MKTRESGMPEERLWRSFFDPEVLLATLGLNSSVRDVADFGCGYGTFSLPAARIISGTLYGFDIDAQMIAACEGRAVSENTANVCFQIRDFVLNGTGLDDESVDYVMLFNILHAEDPGALLREAWRILNNSGLVAVIHWNYDPATPRGPSMDIRPQPVACQKWVERAGFVVEGGIIELPPYHYGLLGRKKGYVP